MQTHRGKIRMSIALIAFAIVALSLPTPLTLASTNHTVIVAQYRQDVPVTLDAASANEISTLDPSLASDTVSISVIENLFLGLTNMDPATNQILPELATAWEVDTSGTRWTFTLRDDVYWLRYDPATQEADRIRPVNAGDVVYGIKRSCDPRLGGYYGTILAKVIAGCDAINQTPRADVTDSLVYGDTVQAIAPNDTTVIIELSFPASFFLSMTPLVAMRPLPAEAITGYGDDWTDPGTILTNGPFFIEEVARGVRRRFVRNETLPQDLLSGNGNIEVVNNTIVEDLSTAFALYQRDRIDSSSVPPAELQALLEDPDYQDQILQIFDLSVFYFGYMHDKPPFDNIHVRRAFSAIISREAFVAQLRGGRGLPAIHFTPPGLAHAPPINEIGVGFDPVYAADQLAQAGYPDCQGLADVTIVTYSGAGSWGEFWAASAERYLGCEPELFTIEQVEFSVLLELIDSDTPAQDRPNAWTLGWSPNYADANSFVNDVLSCTAENRFRRNCSAVDDLIEEAAREPDPAVRDELYAEVESAFFGPEGDFPLVPLFVNADYILVKPWFDGPFQTDGIFSGVHWDAYSIDMAAKLAARG
ncbi:MAG: peptide ABC transporter substrate-binding protein [Chloroflexi bacterium]|nr:peptide ABC transporter substrate-binding protein [Chloroflexota bacterium]